MIRSLVVHALHYSGFLWLLAAARLRGNIAVLTYHRVLPASLSGESFSSPGIMVTPENFDRHMRFLRRHLNPIDVWTFEKIISTGQEIRPGTCLVTFDDGWWDNLEFALPILKRHEIPAVFFVASDYIGTDRRFWQERLACRLFHARKSPSATAFLTQLGLEKVIGAPPAVARQRIRQFVDDLKTGPMAAVEEIFNQLNAVSPDSTAPNVDRFLTWNELASIAHDQSFAIASHGSTHMPFTLLSPESIRQELTKSRTTMLAHLGIVANALAYPNGDADEDVAAIVRDSGISLGFTTRRGLASRRNNPLLLPRINIHESATRGEAAFLFWMLALTG